MSLGGLGLFSYEMVKQELNGFEEKSYFLVVG